MLIKNNIYIFRNTQEDSERENIERYFSINLLSKYMFMKSGIWENIESNGIQPYKKPLINQSKIERIGGKSLMPTKTRRTRLI